MKHFLSQGNVYISIKALLFVLIFTLFISFTLQAPMNFTITDQKTLSNLPSASGIIKYEGFYYSIGDDSQYLFKLNQKFRVVKRYRIHSPDENPKKGRIPKSVKPDFEGLEMISEGLFMVIGSGSKSPQRDQLIMVNAHDGFTTQQYQLTDFYASLQKMDIMEGSELNLEAIAYANNILYIFNRGKNVIFKVNYEELLAYLTEAEPLPSIEATAYDLPKIKGIDAGFSGATFYEQENVLLVTASVENTDNAYDDGEVLGSFLGIIPINGNDNEVDWHLINNQGKPLKIESVAIDNILENNTLEITLVADHDDGSSTFLRGKLDW